jgi:hypothetical protein
MTDRNGLLKKLFFFLIFAGLAAMLQTISQMAAIRTDAMQAITVADSIQVIAAERGVQIQELEQSLAAITSQAGTAMAKATLLRARVDSVYVRVADVERDHHPLIELQQTLIEEQDSVIRGQEEIIGIQANLLILKDETIRDLTFAVDTLKAALPMNLPRLDESKFFGLFPKPSKATVILGAVTVGALIYAASR